MHVGTGDQRIVLSSVAVGTRSQRTIEGDSVQGHTRVESRARHRSRLSRAAKVSRLVPLGGSPTVRRDTPQRGQSLSAQWCLPRQAAPGCHGFAWIRTVAPHVVVSRHAAPRKWCGRHKIAECTVGIKLDRCLTTRPTVESNFPHNLAKLRGAMARNVVRGVRED